MPKTKIFIRCDSKIRAAVGSELANEFKQLPPNGIISKFRRERKGIVGHYSYATLIK